jgi:hypothetical protein
VKLEAIRRSKRTTPSIYRDKGEQENLAHSRNSNIVK